MNNPPPPPPPHGEAPKSSGLPHGKYDVFIIPPHSSGAGFLYLPSLKPSVNSFAAGFASALIMVALGSMLAPALRTWWATVQFAGGMGTLLLILAVGVGAWAFGRTQTDGGPGPGGGGPNPGASANPGAQSHGNGYANGTASGGHQPGAGANPNGNGYANGAAPGGHQPGAQTGYQPGPSPDGGPAGGEFPGSSWQRPPEPTGASTHTPPNAGASANARPNTSAPNNAARGAWEKAREETKKKEEERKAKEAEKKRKEDLEKRLKEMREKDAREREAREKAAAQEKEARDKAAKEKADKDAREARLKELKELREKKKAEEDLAKTKGSTYAFSAVGEKTNPWPRGQPPPPVARSQPSSPARKPPPPTAKTYLGTDEDAFSYRPYDKPTKPMHKKSHSSLYSESSYAASHSTSRTTPPPSQRGPYSTKDPDKIVIKAVYAFNNTFLKTPTSQLVSGVGSVTDGLILRITTEGLFIDDDVRGVPQREWDVKAWTMKLVEVWCPSFRQDPAGPSARVASSGSPRKHNPVRRLWGLDKEKVATSEETDALLVEMVQLCKDNCRFRASSAASSSVYSASSAGSSDDHSESSFASSYASSVGSSSPSYKRRTDNRGAHQTGELKNARLHVLRASIRDQEGKKFVFIIAEEESWKISIGLQRLRKGSLVRAFGVSGMSSSDARSTLESLGWT